jgi:hypothetical protein
MEGSYLGRDEGDVVEGATVLVLHILVEIHIERDSGAECECAREFQGSWTYCLVTGPRGFCISKGINLISFWLLPS